MIPAIWRKTHLDSSKVEFHLTFVDLAFYHLATERSCQPLEAETFAPCSSRMYSS